MKTMMNERIGVREDEAQRTLTLLENRNYDFGGQPTDHILKDLLRVVGYLNRRLKALEAKQDSFVGHCRQIASGRR
jgi:hypothetical protein